MSERAEGVVQKIHTKTGQGKKGPWTLYRTLIGDEWYGCGFDKPKFSEGDNVEIEWDEDQYGKNVKRSKVLGSAPPTSAPSAPGGGTAPTHGVGAAWGNACNVAANLIAAMASVDALPLSAATNKGARAKRFAEFQECFDKLRVELYNDSMDIERVLARVADAGAVTEEPPAPLPTDPEEGQDDGGDDDGWDS